jgi:ApaG protein
MSVSRDSLELEGLSVRLNHLIYRRADPEQSGGSPHTFIYYLSILNGSDRTITLLGRKWVIEQDDGEKLVIEGEKIVGETPTLEPGTTFTYNSFHLTNCPARAFGSFHGIDEFGNRIHVRIPTFRMTPPES